MRQVFVDTSHYVALLSPRELVHSRAHKLANALTNTQFVTTDAILVEVLAFFSGAGPTARHEAVTVIRGIRISDKNIVLPQTRELFDAGLALYASRPDKGYSLTDCMSMVVCREYEIDEVLTHDHHFEQEGLTALLR